MSCGEASDAPRACYRCGAQGGLQFRVSGVRLQLAHTTVGEACDLSFSFVPSSPLLSSLFAFLPECVTSGCAKLLGADDPASSQQE